VNVSTGIIFLDTNIGRGHPFYISGIVDELRRRKSPIPIEVYDVFESSRGLSRFGWRAVRWVYSRGPASALASRLYASLRNSVDYTHRTPTLSLLGRDLRGRLGGTEDALVVSHPMLVGIFRNRPNLIYQHGELVAPRESIVPGASMVIVPTEDVARSFHSGGYNKHQVLVSGLCIEPELVALSKNAFESRLARMAGTGPLTGLFVSSGAEPKHHVRKIISSVASIVLANDRAIILARRGGRLAKAVLSALPRMGISVSTREFPGASPDARFECVLCTFGSHKEESALTTDWFSQLDFLVGPSHERTNWVMGLGLPMFVLTPVIGPYAPLNLRLMEESECAISIKSDSDAHGLGAALADLRKAGSLAAMARNGWGKRDVRGFARIAEFFSARFCQ
jgi:hypothetical protein